jgi:hypothetical protein
LDDWNHNRTCFVASVFWWKWFEWHNLDLTTWKYSTVVGLYRCLRKSDLILKIVIVQINKPERLQFSPYERKTLNVFIYPMCWTEHVWMCARGRLFIEQFMEATQQLLWEWHPTNRRLCVCACAFLWKKENQIQKFKGGSEQLAMKPLHLVKVFYNGWNNSEQLVAWRKGRALCHRQCHHERKLTIWHMNIKWKPAY